MLEGKKILLGITGSIAAYKSILLTRLLVKEGAEVKIVMTPAAKDFVTPLTLSTLSKNEVLVDIYKDSSWANHVMLGRWADCMLIAPVSCNTLAKMANGLCDNLLMSVYLSATCPVFLAPAMDEDMWKHKTTQQNVKTLKLQGNILLPVENGELASGLIGEGRMAEPEAIAGYLINYFTERITLSGKKALVTAGPTYEQIDPVRFIGNYSSGKMGVALAKELKKRGADVTLVLGPTQTPLSLEGLSVVHIHNAEEMLNACVAVFDNMDITIMAAAVADYKPADVADQKIKKNDGVLELSLHKTTDILKCLGNKKKDKQVLVGFALETNNERENAIGKLKQKNADIIVLNSLRDESAGFGKDTNKVTVFNSSGGEKSYETKSKEDVAKDIVDYIIEYQNA
ncbi:MAG: bifunctional phosphopantothenoylcysteine decarboxylase/phosphopantothenate--cysteine ligase CoaBC [Bacteroidetes bacterium]|nr:bifunctional phosphopantothenoylcysteine decarboxylase/phosphopantothenate--cysteine ligase CoaBC [Bacteroidota bacterium]